MKLLLAMLTLVFGALIAAPGTLAADMAESHPHHSHHAGEQATHACPMHPDVTGQPSDDCPKCGMKLSQKLATSGEACPMHAKMAGDKQGDCTKCKKKHRHAAHKATHACPMHADVTRQPSDDCPKCGMKLSQKISDDMAKGHKHHH